VTLPVHNGIRRVVLVHTAGPYPGLRQILGLTPDFVDSAGCLPEVLPQHPAPAVALPPDGRFGKALRVHSNDKYVVYAEKPVEMDAVVEVPAA
jgi:hypothetical protein